MPTGKRHADNMRQAVSLVFMLMDLSRERYDRRRVGKAIIHLVGGTLLPCDANMANARLTRLAGDYQFCGETNLGDLRLDAPHRLGSS
jgi:hypothetical protein